MIIRQAAFAGNTQLLKGALHCHTTRSDGKGAPADVLRLHKQNGYSFVAITDHRNYNYENFAPETGLTIIPGMEFDAGIFPKGGVVHCFHEVVIGPSREDGNPFAQDERCESGRVADYTEFQPFLDEFHAKGNLTLYCHPEWSSTPAREFEKLQGNFGMEIWNSGCAMEDDMDTNAAYWDELLQQGIRIWGVATDDGHKMEQHCNGWVMVSAKNDINSILAALEAGAFYSSCGPEIYDFRIEDGKAILECSPAANIAFHFTRCPNRRYFGDGITRAEHDVPESATYVRAIVTDADGRRAWTNPIYIDK